MARAAARILIGTSGFSYDDWRGTWYPPSLPRPKMLEYYASVFDVLEINATYYRIPGRATAEGMVERAEDRLWWAIKAPGEVTHKRQIGPDVIVPTMRFLEPFYTSGRLLAVLFQFPVSFKNTPPAWDYLHQVSQLFAGMPLVVEMRSATWDTAAADRGLAQLFDGRAMIDQPELSGMAASRRLPRWGSIAYARFHGRNAAEWYGDHDNSVDRYRYSYHRPEIDPWVPTLREAAEGAETAMAFFNNHPEGGAAKNAEMLADMMGISLRGKGYQDFFTPEY